MKIQGFSSMNTSINTTRLPAAYTHICWEYLKTFILGNKPTTKNGKLPYVLDYGCGKKINHLCFRAAQEGFTFMGYDPYWGPVKEMTPEMWESVKPTIIICSNVLNVLHDYSQMLEIHHKIKNKCDKEDIPYIIKIYEGDKSGVGRETKPNCWQRNQITEDYLFPGEVIRKGFIVPKEHKFVVL